MHDFESETGRFELRPSAERYADWVRLCGGVVTDAKPQADAEAAAAREPPVADPVSAEATPEPADPPAVGSKSHAAEAAPAAQRLVVMPLQLLDRSDKLQATHTYPCSALTGSSADAAPHPSFISMKV